MTPEELQEIRSLVFAALLDYEDMKRARRLKAVKKAIQGTIAATALSSVGCVNVTDKQALATRNVLTPKFTLVNSQKPVIQPVKTDVFAKLPNHKQTIKGVVHFAFDSSGLALAHQERLDSLVEQLPKNVEIAVVGFTDSSGNAGYNLKLGKERARMVAKYLAWRGVSVRSVASKGEQVRSKGWDARRVDIVVSHSSPDKLAINLPPLANEPTSARNNHQQQSIVQPVTKVKAQAANPVNIAEASNKLEQTDKASNKTEPPPSVSNKKTISGVVHFPPGSSNLALAHRDRLDSFIRQLPKDAELTVVGRSSLKGDMGYDNELGKKRALTVAKYLASRGVAVLSYGSKRLEPRSGWAARSVDIVVSHPSADDLAINLPLPVEKSARRTSHIIKTGIINKSSTDLAMPVKTVNNSLRSAASTQNEDLPTNTQLLYDIQSKMTDTALDEVH
jgi:outer membrane protein OmpA-like peptidoglycan-associated protein